MEVDANVWAKLSSESPWFRGCVVKKEALEIKNKKNEIEKVTKFTIAVQDADGISLNRTEEITSGLADGSNVEFEFVKLRNQTDEKADDVQDLTVLNYLHEPAILYCLKSRFDRNLIYTNTGPILIAINPFKALSVYDNSNVIKYREAGQSARFKDQESKLPPHVYRVADSAYRNMVEIATRNIGETANQSVLVSGESGAGKTVTTKFIMRYLADITKSEDTPGKAGIEQQVLQSNPVLECFGNARTLRNDNSSRFGKFIEIKFSPIKGDSYRIIGATVRTYLLEKVRLVHQGAGERNFHCFYEIVKGGSEDDMSRWGLTTLDDYHYTNQSGEDCRRDGVHDNDQYKESRSAMNDMGFTIDEQNNCLNVVAALLHLGNLQFDVKAGLGEEEDGSKVNDATQNHLQYCCKLLGFTNEKLEKVLCEKQIKTKEKTFTKRQTVNEAEHGRDALAKTVYGALFEWIVKRVNDTIGSKTKGSSKTEPFIGVLDIFGFESFQKNSFEQLCINYTNERLQHHFNEYIFDEEQKLYKREQISWNFIQFPDNNDVIDLLSNKRSGLFALCDEQVLFPRATDLTLVRKFYENCSSHPRFYAGKVEVGKNLFIVKHFAGPVTYSSEGFLEKNHDVLRTDMAVLVKESSIGLVSSLYAFFRVDEPEAPGAQQSPRGHTQKIFSVGGEFRKQLNDLMDNVHTTSPHYVRCLKPNSQNKAGIFDDNLVIDQLRCNGVLEAVRVSRAGYPNRVTFEQFGRRYAILAPGQDRNGGGAWTREMALTLCESLANSALKSPQFVVSADSLTQKDPMVRTGFQIGTSMVFLRRGTFDYVEKGVLTFQRTAALRLQTTYRRYSAMKKYQQMKTSILIIQCSYRCHHAKRTVSLMKQAKARSLLQRMTRGFLSRLRVSKLFPSFCRLNENIQARRTEVKLMNMRRAVQVQMVAMQCRRHLLKKRAAKQLRAAVIIQTRIRVFLNRKTLLRKRREQLHVGNMERKKLAAQLVQEKAKWELERERMAQANRTQSVQLHEQISNLKIEVSQLKRQVEVLEVGSKDWEDRAKSAMKANIDRAAEPSCDDSKLRSMVSTEMMMQLQKANTDAETYRLRVESLEVENKSLLNHISHLKEGAGGGGVNGSDKGVDGVSEIHVATQRSYSGTFPIDNVAITFPDVDWDITKIEAEFKLQLDEFDRRVSAIKREGGASTATSTPTPTVG